MLLTLAFFACTKGNPDDSGDSESCVPEDEICNGVDDDCDGDVDEDLLVQFFADADGDGFGDPAVSVEDCEAPSGHVEDGTDCDDADGGTNPGAVEVCGGADEDCDGLVDDDDDSLDTSTWGTFYTDGDGDGYGFAEVGACALPAGASATGGDCADSDGAVHPGAAEICNGLNDDCDASTSEEGTATWTDSSGTVTDYTANVTGSAAAPAQVALTSNGTLSFCDGLYYVNLDVNADVDIESVGGAEVTTLDGDAYAPIIDLTDGAGHDVVVSGLTLQNGANSDRLFLNNNWAGGGGIACYGDGSGYLWVQDSVLTDNAGDLGGNVSIENCDASFDNTTLELGTATHAAAAFITDSTVEFTDSLLSANASQYAGAIYDYGYVGGSDVTLDNTVVDGNSATATGGAFYVYASHLSCLDSSFTNNSATQGEAIFSSDSVSTLEASGCDFGTNAGEDDNTSTLSRDLYWYTSYYEAGDDVSFECDNSGCGTAGSDVLGGTASVSSNYLYGNVILATEDATLHSFSQYAYASTSACATSFYVLSAASETETNWTVEWVGSTSVPTSAGYVSSGAANVAIEDGTHYAMVYSTDCGSTIAAYYEANTSSATSLGDGVGYAYGSAISGEVGDSVSINVDSASAGYESIFAQELDYTLFP